MAYVRGLTLKGVLLGALLWLIGLTMLVGVIAGPQTAAGFNRTLGHITFIAVGTTAGSIPSWGDSFNDGRVYAEESQELAEKQRAADAP